MSQSLASVISPSVGWRLECLHQAGIWRPGFAGDGHLAREVFQPGAWPRTNPFILLMDDLLDFSPGERIGAEHPHAGIATATLMLEGTLVDEEEGRLEAGDLHWMVAGSGVVHNNSLHSEGHARALQLWVGLPKLLRKTAPLSLKATRSALPIGGSLCDEADLAEAWRYSAPLNGLDDSFGELSLVHLKLGPGQSIAPSLTAGDTVMAAVLSGSVAVGDTKLVQNDVAWLRGSCAEGTEVPLELTAGAQGAHALVVAAPLMSEQLIHYGAFAAGSSNELSSFFVAFGEGRFAKANAIDLKLS